MQLRAFQLKMYKYENNRASFLLLSCMNFCWILLRAKKGISNSLCMYVLDNILRNYEFSKFEDLYLKINQLMFNGLTF